MNVLTKCGIFIVSSLGFCIPALAIHPQNQNPDQTSVGQEAVSVILKHYARNPLAGNPKTGQALSADGHWAVAKTAPPICAEHTNTSCMTVLYQVPADAVQCTWVVLLDSDGKDGSILDENDDAEHYLMRVVAGEEASRLVSTRQLPLYPPIARAAHVPGDVMISVMVGTTGAQERIDLLSGPEMLRASAIDAERAWRFKPLIVGARAVPYNVRVIFEFRIRENSLGGLPAVSVQMNLSG